MKSFHEYLREDPVHPFERRGLGQAPYTYTGLEKKVHVQGTGAYATEKPGSTCDYCGTAIAYAYWFTSRDKKQFKVGSECMLKADSHKLDILVTEPGRYGYTNLKGIVDQEKKKIQKLNQQKKIAAAASEAKAAVEQHAAQLRALPHPKGFGGKTLYDYCMWMMSRGMYKQVLAKIAEL